MSSAISALGGILSPGLLWVYGGGSVTVSAPQRSLSNKKHYSYTWGNSRFALNPQLVYCSALTVEEPKNGVYSLKCLPGANEEPAPGFYAMPVATNSASLSHL